ncbi:MAG: phosphohistidine phosphatase SixA [Colwellia sp.]
MDIYIMRHGQAQDFIGAGSMNDSQRALNEHGESEVRLMANWFEKRKVNPEHIFVSPYVRAVQTCDIITSSILSSTVAATITTLDFITPLDDAKSVHDFIDGWLSEQRTKSLKKSGRKNNAAIQPLESLLIISHMPLVSYLVAELTQSSNAPIFATASVAHIDYDIAKMQGTLQSLTSP